MRELRKQGVGFSDNDRGVHQEAGAGILTCLVVGDPVAALDGTPFAGETPGLVYAAFPEVTPSFIALMQPALVLSPLVGVGFDCFDLAGALVEAGFHGRYRAASATLPDPGLVRREVGASFPGLDFDLLLLDPDGTPRVN